MAQKKYHVHGYTSSGRKITVYMYNRLSDALRQAKSIAKSGELESTITKLAKDGRSYDQFILVQAIRNHRTGKITLAIRKMKPNGEWSFG